MRIEERKSISEEKVEDHIIVCSEMVKINGTIYEEGTQFLVKEEANKREDIILDTAIRIGEKIVSKDSVLEEVKKEELEEAFNFNRNLIKMMQGYKATDILGSLWKAMQSNRVLALQYSPNMRDQIMKIYHEFNTDEQEQLADYDNY